MSDGFDPNRKEILVEVFTLVPFNDMVYNYIA